MGRIFAGLVGQSEGNLRSVIQTAEAMAPCVLITLRFHPLIRQDMGNR